MRPHLAVKASQLGVVGNGVADDTAALQAAIDYVCANAMTLILDGPDYLITSGLTVWDACTIEGEPTTLAHWPSADTRPGTTTITLDDDGTGWAVTVGGLAATQGDSGAYDSAEGVRLGDFTIRHADGYGVGNGLMVDGSYVDVATRGFVRDLVVTNVGTFRTKAGLEIRGNVFDARFTDCGFTANGAEALKVTATPGENIGGITVCGQVYFTNCLFWQYDDDLTKYAVDAANCVFTGGHIQGEMGVKSNNCRFIGTHIEPHTKSLQGSDTVGILVTGIGTTVVCPEGLYGFDHLIQLGTTGSASDTFANSFDIGNASAGKSVVRLATGTGQRKFDLSVGSVTTAAGALTTPVMIQDDSGSNYPQGVFEKFSTRRTRLQSASGMDVMFAVGPTASAFSRTEIRANGTLVLRDSTGTTKHQIGSDSIGFYGATPVARSAAIANATDAASAITQLNALLAHLRLRGDIAT